MSASIEERLAYLGFQLIKPAPLLRPYVDSYWVVTTPAPLKQPAEEYMHPNGGYGIAFNLGDSLTSDGEPIQARVFLDGANQVSRKMGFLGHVKAIGINFQPSGAFRFFNIPLSEMFHRESLSNAISPQTIQNLYEYLAETPTLEQQINFLERWLLQRFSISQDIAPLIPHSLQQIQQAKGQLSIRQLADDLYISQRQLERLFKTQVGITPVHYARLMRISHARQILKKQPLLSQAELGMALGFHDQPHFIREFKAIVGMTPHRYLQRSLKIAET